MYLLNIWWLLRILRHKRKNPRYLKPATTYCSIHLDSTNDIVLVKHPHRRSNFYKHLLQL